MLHGPDRAAHFDAIGGHDLVLTTYPLLPRDLKTLSAVPLSDIRTRIWDFRSGMPRFYPQRARSPPLAQTKRSASRVSITAISPGHSSLKIVSVISSSVASSSPGGRLSLGVDTLFVAKRRRAALRAGSEAPVGPLSRVHPVQGRVRPYGRSAPPRRSTYPNTLTPPDDGCEGASLFASPPKAQGHG